MSLRNEELDNETCLQILEEFNAEFYSRIDLNKILFRQQLEFVTCKDKFARALCSVRAGKSFSCAADLIWTAQSIPECVCLYITLARSSAKRIVWPALKKLIKDNHIEAHFNNSELSITFPATGSIIYLLGANTEQEMDKIRGLSRVAVAYVDEAQLFRSHLKELVTDVLTKRLYDLNGRLRLIGTPGVTQTGYFWDTGFLDEWAQFHWTLHDNEHILRQSGLTAAQLIEQDCRTRGCTIDDPSIQRECFGIWKQDPANLILCYDKETNHYGELPKGVYTYMLGIDLGHRDYNSLSVIAYSDTSPTTYLVEEKLTSGQLTDDLAKDVKNFMKKYRMAKIVCDAGGLGLQIVEDLKARHGLPIEAADKPGKMASYAILNNALRNGTFKAKENSAFAQDCFILEKDWDKSTPDKIVVKGHSDAVDSCLYIFKFSPAFTWRAPPIKAKPGTKEYEDQQAAALFQNTVDKLKREKEMKDGSGRNWEPAQDMSNVWNRWGDD